MSVWDEFIQKANRGPHPIEQHTPAAEEPAPGARLTTAESDELATHRKVRRRDYGVSVDLPLSEHPDAAVRESIDHPEATVLTLVGSPFPGDDEYAPSPEYLEHIDALEARDAYWHRYDLEQRGDVIYTEGGGALVIPRKDT